MFNIFFKTFPAKSPTGHTNTHIFSKEKINIFTTLATFHLKLPHLIFFPAITIIMKRMIMIHNRIRIPPPNTTIIFTDTIFMDNKKTSNMKQLRISSLKLFTTNSTTTMTILNHYFISKKHLVTTMRTFHNHNSHTNTSLQLGYTTCPHHN